MTTYRHGWYDLFALNAYRMRLLFKSKPPSANHPARRGLARRTHEGIRLRIGVPSGTILLADSDMLHAMARLGHVRSECTLQCRPSCDEHGWTDLLGMVNTDITLEIKPVELPDELPED